MRQVQRPCPGSGLRIGARFLKGAPGGERHATCPRCLQDVRVTVVKTTRPHSSIFTRTIDPHNRTIYTAGD